MARARDAQAFVAWLDAQKAVDTKKKIGPPVTAWAGPIVLRTAGAVPSRIGAAATFHGGGLTTKDATSPHLSIAKSKASYLICIADNDDKNDPTSKDILRQTFADAKLKAEVEVYTARSTAGARSIRRSTTRIWRRRPGRARRCCSRAHSRNDCYFALCSVSARLTHGTVPASPPRWRQHQY